MKIDWYKQTKLSTGLLTLRRKAVRDFRVEFATPGGLTYTQHTSLAAAKAEFDALVERDREGR